MNKKVKKLGYYLFLFVFVTAAMTTSLFIVSSCTKNNESPVSYSDSILAQDNNNQNDDQSITNMGDQSISFALQETFRNIVKNTLPAVVHITSIVEQQVPQFPFGFPFFQNPPSDTREVEVYGSGFIISKDGYILTNNHVINDAKEVKVILMDGSEYTGQVLGRDPNIDVAMLKINPGKKNLPILKLGNSDSLEVGDLIIAIGNPFGLDGTVTQGIVSAKGRFNIGVNTFENFIQIDAAINPGNSGGPLINLNGEVIGINDAILSSTQQFAGIGFAIPSNMITPIMDNLIENKPIEHGYLGISLQAMTKDKMSFYDVKDTSGALVVYVEKNSPAEKSGLLPGDLITEFNGEKIKNIGDLSNKIGMLQVGKEIELTVIRIENDKKKTMAIKVKVGKRPDQYAQGGGETTWMGVSVIPLTDDVKQKYKIYGIDKGVVVVDIQANSLAAKAGINKGDVIMQINEYEIQNINDFYSILEKVKNNKKFRFVIYRKGTMLLITISK